jgi:pimeloyl-ACP methyl ester carboxylesterase
VESADGRRLRVEDGGDPSGKPVLMHHGMPGAGLLYPAEEAEAREHGIRLIGYDRPGYGGSTPQPGRTVADCTEDVRAIARALDIDRLATWGISGGGPHVLACAALLPDLVVAVASLASVAPYGAPGLDYYTGMGEENVTDTKLLLENEPAARLKSRADRERLLGVSAEEMIKAWPSLLSAVDAAAFTPELSQYMVACNQLGLEPGDEGWWDDGVANIRPWGFDLASITVPVQLWHGRHDQFVPFQHGKWLASVIPGVDAHLTDDDGHLTLPVRRLPQIHAWLLEHF